MKIKEYSETIVLAAGHALLLRHKPEKLSMAEINDFLLDHPQEVQQFGLFDTASPNYSTYYPDVTTEDLNPKDSEFVEPVFRMLSNVTVGLPFNAVHFPADVLKKSMYKLIGMTINIDHEMAVGNAVGSVKAVEWQESYMSGGYKIPAGINATLKIDGKSNPRIARGIMMDPPSIHSNSVTVNFAWKKSHVELSDDEFFSKLGTFDKSGKLIQKVVYDIKAYYETSLVSHGADPFAQKIGKDGKIINPQFAGGRYLLNNTKKLSDILFSYDWKSLEESGEHEEVILNSQSIREQTEIINNSNLETMDELLKFLHTFFGFEEGTLTEENLQEKLGEINFLELKEKAEKTPEPVVVLDLTGVEAIEQEITTLRTFKDGVPENYQEQTTLAKFGEEVLTQLRVETKRLYSLTVEQGKEDSTIINLIESADSKTLQSLHKQYEKTTEGKFSFACTDCGSHNITRASASGANGEEDFVTRSNQEALDHFTGTVEAKLPAWMKGK